MEKRNIRILAILLIIAFFFSFIQTRPYSVRHSTVYTNDNTLEIELYIVTNRFLSSIRISIAKKLFRSTDVLTSFPLIRLIRLFCLQIHGVLRKDIPAQNMNIGLTMIRFNYRNNVLQKAQTSFLISRRLVLLY